MSRPEPPCECEEPFDFAFYLRDFIERNTQAEHAPGDQVEHPSHYASGAIECFDAMQAMATAGELIAYCRLAAFKYIWRAGKKGPAGVDYRKAIWYLTKAAELEEAKK